MEESSIAAGGAAHELISRAVWVGARDAASLEVLRANLPRRSGSHCPLRRRRGFVPVARPRRPRGRRQPAPQRRRLGQRRVGGDYRAGDLDPARLGGSISRPLELQPMIAYEDHRISEAAWSRRCSRGTGDDLERSGATPARPLDFLADASGTGSPASVAAALWSAAHTMSRRPCCWRASDDAPRREPLPPAEGGGRSRPVRARSGPGVGVEGAEPDAESAVAVLPTVRPGRVGRANRCRRGADGQALDAPAGREAALTEAIDGTPSRQRPRQ